MRTNRKSMSDLLSIEEDKAAAKQGWGLHHVYDQDVDQWVVRVLPITFRPPLPDAKTAGAYVVNLARSGDGLAQKALQILMHGVPKK